MRLIKNRLGGGSNNRGEIELQAFREPNKKRKIILATMLFSMLVLSCMYLYKTYAVFTEEKHFNVINGEVQDPGDIYFAYYADNTITRSMPKKGTGYTLDTEKSNCTNGVIPKWDNGGWQFIGDYSDYNATDYTRTRCNLYFKKIDITAVDYIKELAKYDTETLATDEAGGNVRYIGKSPDNYVNIDGDIWRIIGVMKDIDDGTGKKSDRVKLIRSSSIGKYSWDSSDSKVNYGKGVNEWSQADLMKLLNPGYESESVGGSLYWNGKSGTCYSDQKNITTSCDFTSTGIKDKLKRLIGNVNWGLGSVDGVTYTFANISTIKSYEFEQSTNTGKICDGTYQGGIYCTDTVIRTTTWTGKVGLMYPSDYGYATSGGSTIDRAKCLKAAMHSWNNDLNFCYENNWLSCGIDEFTLTPSPRPEFDYDIFSIHNKVIDSYSANAYINVRPVVYLKPSVSIQSGDGSENSPFILE